MFWRASNCEVVQAETDVLDGQHQNSYTVLWLSFMFTDSKALKASLFEKSSQTESYPDLKVR